VVNADGSVLFQSITRPFLPRHKVSNGLFILDTFRGLETVVFAGDRAVGPTGADLVDVVWSGFSAYGLSDHGPFFVGKLTGKMAKPDSNVGLWGEDSAGRLRLLIRTGTELALSNGSKKLAKIVLLDSPVGTFGARRSFSASGSIAILATFTDKTQALIRFDVP
jgi:hypothetical protein